MRRLRASQLNATAERELVRVRQGPYEIRDFPRVWRRRSYEPTILIEHDPQKFLYNGNIASEFGKFPIEADLETIKQVMNATGYVTMEDGDLDSEIAIVRGYLPERTELIADYDELRRLEQEKHDSVARQDFEKAAAIRDQQDAIRNRMESLAVAQFRRCP